MWIYIIGLLAQCFFSARIIVQWFLSEKEKRVVSPVSYWICSLLGSYLLFIYGWLREDFAIILGQVLSYYIYIWNLSLKGVWKRINIFVKFILLFTPVVAVFAVVKNIPVFVDSFLNTSDIPLWLLVFGSAGQVIFAFRFVYQWYISVKRKESILPAGFWALSLLGSGMILTYGVIRLDPILVLGQSFGFVAYVRNLFIGKNEKQQK